MNVNTASGKDELRTSKRYPQDRANVMIEEQTKKIPNLSFVGLALASMGLSAYLISRKKTDFANFVGLWAPTILIFGLYNKIVKVEDEAFEAMIRH